MQLFFKEELLPSRQDNSGNLSKPIKQLKRLDSILQKHVNVEVLLALLGWGLGGDKGWGEGKGGHGTTHSYQEARFLVVCYINEMKFGKKLICAEGIVDKANLLLTFTTYFQVGGNGKEPGGFQAVK